MQFSFKFNYSNQLKSLAKISFTLQHEAPVSIKVYNLSGRHISTLIEKNLGAGEHLVFWDARNMANGCYTIKMVAGTNIQAKVLPLFQ